MPQSFQEVLLGPRGKEKFGKSKYSSKSAELYADFRSVGKAAKNNLKKVKSNIANWKETFMLLVIFVFCV